MTIALKTCGSCKLDLPITRFGKNRSKKDGLQSWCTECQRAACRSTKDSRMVWHECTICEDGRLVDSRQIRDDLICGKCQRDNVRMRNAVVTYLMTPARREQAAMNRARKYSREVIRDLKRVHKRVVRELQWIEVRKPRECQNCGESFVTESWTKRYCSDECAGRSSRNASITRYGRFRPSATLRLAIYERDGWRCFCGDLVIPWGSSDNPYDPLYATLDHVQPRSLGGSDDESNLRTAHFGCNSERGADPDWELAAA